ncbi:MAG: xanthine dehydrogenase family protein subunit M [Chloroflexi bacterium]|nr:xanthine dehydrogenase family protein subunit M [Chloroflexota bacterium]
MNLIRRLPPFEYLTPATVEEACKILDRRKGKAKVLAGGTDLLVQMKQRKVVPECLVSLKNIPGLDQIQVQEGEGVRIGALVTHQTLAASPIIKEKFTCLAEACRKIASPQIRSIATIGGNLCNGNPSADSAPALLALDARISKEARHSLSDDPLWGFFVEPFQANLRPDHVVTQIFLRFLPERSASSYQYLTKRTAVDETLVGAAAAVTLDRRGLCREVGIGLCSVGPVPFLAVKAEEVLKGKKLDAAAIEKAAQTAAGETSPRSRADYRREMTAVVVSRALTKCWQEIAGRYSNHQ